jgi:hypothetical protein
VPQGEVGDLVFGEACSPRCVPAPFVCDQMPVEMVAVGTGGDAFHPPVGAVYSSLGFAE